MTTKPRQFPLPLSSVVNQRDGAKQHVSRQTATPQTATQNAATHLSSKRPSATSAAQTIVRNSSSQSAAAQRQRDTPSGSAMPLVSDAVRHAMVKRVEQQGVRDSLTLSALRAVPRHLFIESGMAGQAYVDASLPIGHHQTISQPYIVGRMIEIMRNGRELNQVLEIGTGCGYQAAVLSLVCKNIYSIERIKALHELAKNNLRPMRIPNIRLHYGDGMLGLPQAAPFDGIILAAAGLEVPQALLEQLTIGGRLIAPVGGKNQVLELIERVSKYEWKNSVLEHCHFVPLRQGVI